MKQPPLSVDDILAAVPSARLVPGSRKTEFSGVTIDTRDTSNSGKLFVALKGKRFDAHTMLDVAKSSGVAALLIESGSGQNVKKLIGKSLCAVITCKNTKAALGKLAAYYRARLDIDVVAITGSCGKTTVKNFVSNVLATEFRVVSAPKSFNNDIGVPLTILSAKPSTQVLVLEIGMNHLGEISRLTRIADPDVQIITNIGSAHIGYLKTEREVAVAKSEILTASRSDTVALLPSDSKYFKTLKVRAGKRKIITFGAARGTDAFPKSIDGDGRSSTFEVDKTKYRMPISGKHNVVNAVIAITIGKLFSIDPFQIRKAVSSFVVPPGRGNVYRSGKFLMLDSSYNANPNSMQAALEELNLHIKRGIRPILVLGEMQELGIKSKQYHRKLGELIAKSRPLLTLFVGPSGKYCRWGYLNAGGAKTRFHAVDSVKMASEQLIKTIEKENGAAILVKGSRDIGLENIVDTVRKRLKMSKI